MKTNHIEFQSFPYNTKRQFVYFEQKESDHFTSAMLDLGTMVHVSYVPDDVNERMV